MGRKVVLNFHRWSVASLAKGASQCRRVVVVVALSICLLCVRVCVSRLLNLVCICSILTAIQFELENAKDGGQIV